MKCPVCGSYNVHAQVVPQQELKEKRKGLLYWLIIGFWWEPFVWIFFTLPKAIVTIFKPKRYQLKTTNKTMFTCQKCGYTWPT